MLLCSSVQKGYLGNSNNITEDIDALRPKFKTTVSYFETTELGHSCPNNVWMLDSLDEHYSRFNQIQNTTKVTNNHVDPFWI